MKFTARLIDSIQKRKSRLVVGLDPRWDRLPEKIRHQAISRWGETLKAGAWGSETFCREVLDCVSDIAAAVKIQLAYFEIFGPSGYESYVRLVKEARSRDLPVIADGKRSDIGATSQAYARAHLGSISLGKTCLTPLGADALTVNPYLGWEGIEPFLEVNKGGETGIFLLLRTSNPSSDEIQLWPDSQRPLYLHLAEKVGQWALPYRQEDTGYSTLGVVMGATYPQALEKVRGLLPHSFFLLPGFGHQGGKAAHLEPAFQSGGLGALVNSSRGIIFAFQGDDYKREIRQAAQNARRAINEVALK